MSVNSISDLLLCEQLIETTFLFSGYFKIHFFAFSLACCLWVK